MLRSTLLSAVGSALRGRSAPAPGETLIVGLSGGADSVALLDALVQLGARHDLRLVAAHLDHGLRPGGGDRHFCELLCRRLGVPLRVGRADVAARARREGEGIEAAGRRARHAFLRHAARREGASGIALAHTRDDQAETLLLRLLRGAGSTGLGAMRVRRGRLFRPLLGVSRRQVLEHLTARGLEWREDPTNADPAFARNRVRHELLPYLEERFNPRIRESLAGAAVLLRDEADHLEAEAADLLERLARPEDGGWRLERAPLAAAPRAVARRALRLFLKRGGAAGAGRVHVERLLALADARNVSGRQLPLPGGRVVRVRFDALWLGSPVEATAFSMPLSVPGRVELPGGGTLVASEWFGGASGEGAVAVPRSGGLTVRTRRAGDRVLRRGREVSLKRVLLDRRVPADRRNGLPLVASGSRVLWGPGLGIDAGATAGEERLIRVELEAPGLAGTRPAATGRD